MDKISKVWPDWHEEEIIGEGTYGKVYKVYREDLGHKTYSAIKVIELPHEKSEIKELSSSGMNEGEITSYYENMANLLLDEIKIMESLKSSENIVIIEDYKLLPKEDGVGWTIYIRMELLKSLREYITEHKMTLADVINLGIDISAALSVCAKVGVIHRDIKIDNIFINSFGRYKLGDFGVAKQLEKTQSALSKKGTNMYMAPEVYKGEKYDATVDIYSLGIVMYRLLNNGRYPFMPEEGQTIRPGDVQEALNRRINGEMFPKAICADEEMMNIIRKACAHEPIDRYHSASEFSDDLKNYEYKNTNIEIEDRRSSESEQIEEKTEAVIAIHNSDNHIANKEKKKKTYRVGLVVCFVLIAIIAVISSSKNKEQTNSIKHKNELTDKIQESTSTENIAETRGETTSTESITETSSLGTENNNAIVYDFTFEMEGENYSIPMEYNKLVETGWKLQNYDDTNMNISGYSYEQYAMKKNNSTIIVRLYNNTTNNQSMEQCIVGGIDFQTTFIHNFHVKGFDFSSDIDKITEIFGEPYYFNEDETIVSYKFGEEGQDVYVYWSKNDDYKNITIENYNSIELVENDDVSSERPKYLDEYSAPQSISGQSDVAFSADGYIYRIPCPISEFINNGWNISEGAGQTIPSQNISNFPVKISKDDITLEIRLANFDEKEMKIENCAVVQVSCYYKVEEIPKDYFQFCEGLTSNSSDSEFENKLTNFESNIISKNSTSYSNIMEVLDKEIRFIHDKTEKGKTNRSFTFLNKYWE